MSDFSQFKRLGVAEARPVTEEEINGNIDSRISISQADLDNGSPKAGDMIARNPLNHVDQWLIAKDYFVVNFSDVKHDFGWAIQQLKLGKKVARSGWNGKGMFIFLVQGSRFEVNRPPLLGIYPEGTVIDYQPHIDMKTADNTVVPWLASQSDVLAEDWEIVE